MKYKDLDVAVSNCLKVYNKKKCNRDLPEKEKEQPIFMGKTDVLSALRLMPLSRASWPWTIMKAVNPKVGEWNFFIDKCLPFG